MTGTPEFIGKTLAFVWEGGKIQAVLMYWIALIVARVAVIAALFGR